MELNIKKSSYEGRWFDFGNGRLKIRPYPASRGGFGIKDGAFLVFSEQTFDKFKYCLEAWDNYVTPAPENKPIELTDEVKKKVFDFRLGIIQIGGSEMSISDFVIVKAEELYKEALVAEKNS